MTLNLDTYLTAVFETRLGWDPCPDTRDWLRLAAMQESGPLWDTEGEWDDEPGSDLDRICQAPTRILKPLPERPLPRRSRTPSPCASTRALTPTPL